MRIITTICFLLAFFSVSLYAQAKPQKKQPVEQEETENPKPESEETEKKSPGNFVFEIVLDYGRGNGVVSGKGVKSLIAPMPYDLLNYNSAAYAEQREVLQLQHMLRAQNRSGRYEDDRFEFGMIINHIFGIGFLYDQRRVRLPSAAGVDIVNQQALSGILDSEKLALLRPNARGIDTLAYIPTRRRIKDLKTFGLYMTFHPLGVFYPEILKNRVLTFDPYIKVDFGSGRYNWDTDVSRLDAALGLRIIFARYFYLYAEHSAANSTLSKYAYVTSNNQYSGTTRTSTMTRPVLTDARYLNMEGSRVGFGMSFPIGL